jgi:hypothetical protein
MIIRVRTETLHPVVIGPSPANPDAKGGFEVRTDARIGMTLGIGSVFWMLTAITLTWYRLRMENVVERVQTLKMRLLNQ